MKKQQVKKFQLNLKTISNLQDQVTGGRAPLSPNNSYENSCMAGYCKSINEYSLCPPCPEV